MDKVRTLIEAIVKERGLDLADLSRGIGRNHAYLQQFLKRGVPRELRERERAKLADLLGVDETLLGARTMSSPDSYRDEKSNKIREVAEYDVLASAGGGIALHDEEQRGHWPFNEDYLRTELRLKPGGLALISVKGDSMEPTLRSGDRVLIDLADKNVSQPGLFVLWDGNGRVVKRVERIPATDPAKLMLMSDNPLHSKYEVPAALIDVIGRVVWAARRL